LRGDSSLGNEGKRTEPDFRNRIEKSLLASVVLNRPARIQLAMKKSVLRAFIEVGFIIFLFYSNLLMGEYERSGLGQKKGLSWAIADVFTSTNFQIAVVAALVGYVVFEFLRRRF
jgi:hypothetical protein